MAATGGTRKKPAARLRCRHAGIVTKRWMEDDMLGAMSRLRCRRAGIVTRDSFQTRQQNLMSRLRCRRAGIVTRIASDICGRCHPVAPTMPTRWHCHRASTGSHVMGVAPTMPTRWHCHDPRERTLLANLHTVAPTMPTRWHCHCCEVEHFTARADVAGGEHHLVWSSIELSGIEHDRPICPLTTVRAPTPRGCSDGPLAWLSRAH